MDLQFLIFLFPAGVVLCFRDLRDEHVFVIIYAVMASYFAGVMVRLMLTLTPVVCVSAAVAFSSLLDTYIDPTQPEDTEDVKNEDSSATGSNASSPGATKKSKKAAAAAAQSSTSSALSDLVSATTPTKKGDTPKNKGIFALDTRLAVIINALGMLSFFVFHCTWVTSSAYSSPSVVLASTNPDGSQHIIDDFREAYYWLRQNTPETAVVMSWWDYGYQIAGMADRPTLVDNNTWNNSTCFLIPSLGIDIKILLKKPISPPLAKQCPVQKKSHTPFCASTTWTTFWLSLVVSSGIPVMISTNSCGWSGSHKVFGLMRSRSPIISLHRVSIGSTTKLRLR